MKSKLENCFVEKLCSCNFCANIYKNSDDISWRRVGFLFTSATKKSQNSDVLITVCKFLIMSTSFQFEVFDDMLLNETMIAETNCSRIPLIFFEIEFR